jgi:tRNA A-37 threonylcarbamoyl transferase component Bud32
MMLVGALVPKVYDIDAQEQKFLMEFVNKHEGRLRTRHEPRFLEHVLLSTSRRRNGTWPQRWPVIS